MFGRESGDRREGCIQKIERRKNRRTDLALGDQGLQTPRRGPEEGTLGQ